MPYMYLSQDGIYLSLKRRAEKLVSALNAMDGIECNPSNGAMYSFPRVFLPEKAVTAAKADGVAPDAMCVSKWS